MPVYRGTTFVSESLPSILGQTHRDLRVMISVDGGDAESARACEPYLADERVRLTLHDRRLGWVGNMNWLVDACDGDAFVYWQQDDLCEPQYLARLLALVREHPYPAVGYSDLRWFGGRDQVATQSSTVGFAQQRILAAIEATGWIPLRGLIPTEVLRQASPFAGLSDSIAFSDYLFVFRLAMHADLLRLPEILYHKRAHAASASHRASGDYHVSPRQAWIDFGTAMFREAAPYFDPADHARLAATIAERLAVRRPGRWFHYDATAEASDEPARLAADLITAVSEHTEADLGTLGLGDAGAILAALQPGAASGAIEPVASSGDRRAALAAMLRDRRTVRLHATAGGHGAAILLDGWGRAEDWGTWVDGYRARLWLPIPADGRRWTVRLRGRPFEADGAPAEPRFAVSRGGQTLLEQRLTVGGAISPVELSVAEGAEDGVTLELDLPDAVSPQALGVADDPRLLSFALRWVDIELAGA
jgi:glycosyltransferase involved in cell wall biosynthesis